jgi:hypothetical protein
MTISRFSVMTFTSSVAPSEDGGKAVQRVMGQATPTDVLLPSGALVLAYIDGGVAGDRVSAHDGGAALAEVRQAGFAMTQQVMRAARSAAGRAGLSVEGSILRSPPEALADARVAVIILANGARAVAEAALTAARKKDRIRLRDRVAQQLREIFGDVAIRHEVPLLGGSRTSHRVDWLVRLSDSRQLAIDVPVPDSSSIASTVLRQIDLRRGSISGLHQAIAFDEDDEWTATELSQLAMADVPLVSSRRMAEQLRTMIAG